MLLPTAAFWVSIHIKPAVWTRTLGFSFLTKGFFRNEVIRCLGEEILIHFINVRHGILSVKLDN